MSSAQSAHGLEHVCLSRHVETGRRLVEHDDARAVRKRHRERNALLLSAGQLMRVAVEEDAVARQQHLAEHFRDPRSSISGGRAEPVRGERLLELRPYAKRRVERRRRILRDVRHQTAAEPLAIEGRQREDVAAFDAHFAARDPSAAPRVPEHRQADRRLPRAGLAHEAQHLACRDAEGDPVHDVLAGAVVDLDP